MGFYGTAALQSMGCYPTSMEFDLMIALFLPPHCGFFIIFGCRVFFFLLVMDFSVFLPMVDQQLVMILVFT